MAHEEQSPQQIGIQSNSGGDINIEQSQVHIAAGDMHIHYPQPSPSSHSEPVIFLPTNLPGWYVERVEALDALKSVLLAKPNTAGVVATTAIHGLGGTGKTVLARALCEDQEIRSTFTDGILWATLGQKANPARYQREWIQALGGDITKISSLEGGKVELSRLIANKSFLLVLDDIWNAWDAESLLLSNEHCRVLMTTRDVAQVEGAEPISLGLMSLPSEYRLLLQKASRGKLADTQLIDTIAKRLGYLPLALQVVGSLLGQGIPWTDITSALQEGDLRFLSTSQRDIFSAIATSVHFLPLDKQERYQELVIFSHNDPLATGAIARLWHQTAGYKERDTRKFLADLQAGSLIQTDNRLHDLQYDYLLATTTQEQQQRWHKALVEAYGGPTAYTRLPNDDENYGWRYFVSHIAQAGYIQKLPTILTNVSYLQEKIVKLDTSALLIDFDFASATPFLRDIAGAIRLGQRVLDKEPGELLNQLRGRLGELQQLHDFPVNNGPHLHLKSQTLTHPGSLLQIFYHHDSMLDDVDQVNGCAFSPDGQFALSSSNKALYLWNIQTGQRLREFHGHSERIVGCALSPDGQLALSCSMDHTLRLWNVQAGAYLTTRSAVAAIQDRNELFYVYTDPQQGTVGFAQTPDVGQCLRIFQGHQQAVFSCAFSPDGRSAVSTSLDHTLRLWDVQTGQTIRIFVGHADSVVCCAFSPDGKYILSGSYDDTLRLWDAQSGQCLHIFAGHQNHVFGCAFSPDGRFILSSSLCDLWLWEMQSRQKIRSFEGHVNWVRAVFSSDGRHILSASFDHTLRLWNVHNEQVVRVFKEHSEPVVGCALSQDGHFALSASGDSTMRLWDLRVERETRSFSRHTQAILGCTFSPDGKWALSASSDHTLCLWDVQSQSVIRNFEGHTDWVRGCAFSPDGQLILSSSGDHTMRLWDTQTGQLVRLFEGHAKSVNDCAFSPDGNWAVSASDDCTLRLWDIQTGQLVRLFLGHQNSISGCVFSPDGQHILSSSTKYSLRLWDIQTRKNQQFSVVQGDMIWRCALSPDGRFALYAVRSMYRTRIWDLETGDPFCTFDGHIGPVNACAFSPDGRLALSASDDHYLKIWNVPIEKNMLNIYESFLQFVADSKLLCCAFHPDGSHIIAGDQLGYLHFLSLQQI